MLFMRQLLILLWKNFLIRVRNPITTVFEIFLPLLFPTLIAIMRRDMNPTQQALNETQDMSLIFDKTGTNMHWSAIESEGVLIYYTPDNEFTQNLTQIIASISRFQPKKVQTFYEVKRLVSVSQTMNIKAFGVVFNSNDSMAFDYTLLINQYFGKAITKLFKSDIVVTQKDNIYKKFSYYQILINEAFLTNLVNQHNGHRNETKSMTAFDFPQPNVKKEAQSTDLSPGDIIAIVVVLGYVVLGPLIVKRICDEKAYKIKELLKMMGMSDWVFWSSHFVNYVILFIVHSLVFAFLFCIGIQMFGIGNGNADFRQTNALIVVIIFMVYGIQTIMFCMAFTTVFNKPVIAVIVMTIQYILTFGSVAYYLHPFFAPHLGFSDEGNFNRLVSSVLPNAGLIWNLALIGDFAKRDVGFKLADIYTNTAYFGYLTVAQVLTVQLVSCILYGILIWYLDAVWPFQYGMPKPFYFPCLPSYYCPNKHLKDIESKQSNEINENFESEPKDSKNSISLKNISKEFRGGKGVHNISLNIFNGQITALLGHNGAGKTTTMNMITGIYPPTSGTIRVNGFSIASETENARKSIGLCPQENILYNDLTVREHLKLFAVLKNFPTKGMEQEIEKTVALIRLTPKIHTISSALSGGMKRKLCLGMAMIGGSNVLIMDEPTSGMDPESRRAIWDVLQEVRRKRTILLTTHYMEEADALGDRIAIMSEGRIKCCGSPMFLKKRFGAGYHLRISKAENFNKSLLQEILTKHLPESRLKSEINIEIIYSLESKDPSKQTNKSVFPILFTELEERKSEIGIDSYGISITTMEDVFLKVGSDNEIEDNSMDKKTKRDSYSALEGFSLFIQRFYGLLVKRIHFGLRYWPMILFQILIPCLIFIAIFISDQNSKTRVLKTKHSLALNLSQLYGKTFGFFRANHHNWQPFGEQYYLPISGNHSMNTTFLGQSSDTVNIWLEKIIKTLTLNEYMTKYIIGGALGHVDENNYEFRLNFWSNSEALHSLPLSINLMYETLANGLLKTVNSVKISLTNYPAVREGLVGQSPLEALISSVQFCCFLLLPISTPFLGASYVLYPIHERESKSKFLQLMTGLSSFTFWLSNYVFDFFNHLFAILILIIIFYFFDSNQIFFYENDSFNALLLLFIFFGLSSIAVAYCSSFLFKESENGFTILVIIYIVFGLIINLLLGFSYTQIHLKNDKTTFNAEKWYFDALGLVPILSINFGLTKLFTIGSVKHMCRHFDANYNMTEMCLREDESVINCCQKLCKSEKVECFRNWKALSFERTGVGLDLFIMFLTTVLLIVLIILLEGEYVQTFFANKSRRKGLSLYVKTEDSDVLRDRQFVDQLMRSKTFKNEAIVVINLCKYFGNFRAVNHLTFCVHKNECFGLLGVNGAGKTTTFSMLTGDVKPNEGNAFIGSLNVKQHTKAFQRKIGYCPQFDALLDRLTGEELLYLFARLRGIPSENLRQEVEAVIEMTDLIKHSKFIAMTYSGGNKRKLSLGLSIIGSPSMIFLDEPTAGVDPVARRKIWQTLNMVKNSQNSSFILTSHSMEESEALCARIAIMVSGEFKCLGSTQQLRSKFGQGFTLVIKLKADLATNPKYQTRVTQYIIKRLPSAVLKDKHQCILQFHITDPSVKWSSLFAVMQSAQQDLDLEDYNLSDTTLEQIFLSFAKQQ